MSEITVTLPDGSSRRVSAGSTARDVAAGISPGLAKAALAAEVDGRPVDLACPLTADVALHPHQLDPALAVLRGFRRLLLADEVGLGKTIQAGLVLAELIARSPSSRALVIVPASLRAQWTQEVRVRFGIQTFIADRHGLDVERRAAWRDDNPWLRSGTSVASLDFLKQPHVRDALPLAPWDLVIVDPPSFAPSEKARGKALPAYTRLAGQGLAVTAPGGIFCLASCSSHVTEVDLLGCLADAAGKAGRRVRARMILGAASDHPVLPGFRVGVADLFPPPGEPEPTEPAGQT